MANVFDLTAIIKLDDSAFKSGLQAASSAIGKFAKVAGGAVAAGATAVAGLATSATRAYADYEQLAGGVEKLFGKESAQTMMQYAQNAYKTAGMSANQFMEQSTSFAAALIQSYSGDTAKAADQANKAMMAISDNFNTFGGDISSVQSAFQGFAKQNYTMLDNLKLGYGGTKTEMERLIADANEYAEANGRAADLSIENFGDIVEAINLVQEKQGIAGTTAKEAATTISGSIGMMKAAWQNLLVSFADKNADLGQSFNTLVKSAEIAFDNIVPVAEQAIKGIGQVISDVVPTVGKMLPGLIEEVLPDIVGAGASLLTSVVSGVIQGIPVLVGAIPNIVQSLVDGFAENWPAMQEAGEALINMVGDGIQKAGHFLVDTAHHVWTDILGGSEETWQQMKTSTANAWSSISGTLSKAWNGIKDGASAFGNGIKSFWAKHGNEVTEGFADAWSRISDTLVNVWGSISSIAESVFAGLQNFWNTWGGTIMTIFSSTWETIKVAFKAGLNVLSDLFAVFSAVFAGDWKGAWENVKRLASDAWNGIKAVLSSVWDGIKAVASSVWASVGGTITAAWESVKAKASSIWNSIVSAISSAWSSITSAVSAAVSTVQSTVSSVFSSISSTVSGIWDGIKSTISNTMDSIKSTIQSAVESIKNVMNFSWSLPALKLPHFSVSGGFSLNPPSVPKFSVSWNRKALEEPFMFTEATLFGAGEAGDEVLYGKANLMNDIRTATESSNAMIIIKLDSIFALMQQYFPELANQKVVLDSGRLVGGIGTRVDNQLGNIDGWRRRGLSLS